MTPQTWEYRLIGPDRSEDELNQLGAQGWELVAVSDAPDGTTAYLKRPALGFKERVTLEQRAKYARSQGDEPGG